MTAAPDEVVLSDPRAIRALAHPARIAVLERLFSGEVLTATECARVAGLTPSAMSYHLRALERYGLVQRAEPAGDGRERPWRALGRGIRVDAEHSLAGRAAEGVLFGQLADRLRAEVTAAARHAGRTDPDAAERGSFFLSPATVTPDEARALTEAVLALFEPYREREAPPDAVRYHFWWAGLPVTDDAPDGDA